MDSLGHDAAINQTQNVEHVGKVVDDQKAVVTRLQQALADFRKAYNIDGVMLRQPIELQALGIGQAFERGAGVCECGVPAVAGDQEAVGDEYAAVVAGGGAAVD